MSAAALAAGVAHPVRPMGPGAAVAMFLAFAFAYFFSALLRAVTATLAPVFSAELQLAAGQLGLLAGAYFLGFSSMQLPLGSALDRWGPRRVLLCFLAVAVLGCGAFALARGFVELLLARLLIGVGVAACLMAPLTCFRHRMSTAAQLRANSWMLMTGSLGMLASTLPVQWLLPLIGWRGLFAIVGLLLLLAMAALALAVPADAPRSAPEPATPGSPPPATAGYRTVFGHPAFVRVAPLGLVVYGGMVAMQSLWIGPWLTQVGGQSPGDAARGLFIVNLAMLLAFLCWGLAMPRLTRAGWAGERLIAWAWPLGPLCLAWILWRGSEAGAFSWALWCVSTSVISLSQPAVGQAFAAALAGRALSAFNLMIFSGVFAVQWGIGLLIDALRAAGWPVAQAHRLAFGVFLVLCVLAGLWLNLLRWRADRAATAGIAGR
ncbi:MFS transporter [Aquabacterium sp. OR-4]|nr:MFS transporter [Aquabacterium sp. OR-4]MDT7834278.1 MFS transporter [Aquabacterium sp. OR-4]